MLSQGSITKSLVIGLICVFVTTSTGCGRDGGGGIELGGGSVGFDLSGGDSGGGDPGVVDSGAGDPGGGDPGGGDPGAGDPGDGDPGGGDPGGGDSSGGDPGGGDPGAGDPPSDGFVYIGPIVRRDGHEVTVSGSVTTEKPRWGFESSVTNDLNLQSGTLIQFDSPFRYDEIDYETLSGSYNGPNIDITLKGTAGNSAAETRFSGSFDQPTGSPRSITEIKMTNTTPGLPGITIKVEFTPQWEGQFLNIDDLNHKLDFKMVDAELNSEGEPKLNSGEIFGDLFVDETLENLFTAGDVLPNGNFEEDGILSFQIDRGNGQTISYSGQFLGVSTIQLTDGTETFIFRRDCGNGFEGSCIIQP